MTTPECGGYPVPARAGGEWRNVGPFERLDVEALDGLDDNSSRHFDVGGVLLSLVRCSDGTWRALARHGIPSSVLSGHRSAPRERVDPLDGG